MDPSAVAIDIFNEDSFAADKKKLDAFRLGNPMLSESKPANRRSAHGRTHSRNHSVSVSSLTASTSAPMTVMNLPKIESPPPSPVRSSLGSTKRNSHHKRRSSVSTRHESAEMMGVALPTIPISSSDDNINLGDKDSIRRRALWTLEGKTDMGSFSKVDIPDITSPDSMSRPFEFPSKPSYPPGSGFGSGLSSLLTGKRDRDSYGRFTPSSSAGEQLGTLVEEEEEEEEESSVPVTSSSIEEVPEPAILVSSPSPARHRPATLNLRPLALATSLTAAYGDLPTPSPSPNARSGLRSLTLAQRSDSNEDISSSASSNRKRHSMIVTSSAPSSAPQTRQPSLHVSSDGPIAPPASAPLRRASISYNHSADSSVVTNFGLPTPEMTPISERRYSNSSMESDNSRTSSRGSRPLSLSEQHFLFQAHQTLVQRISDLERALAARPRSRPQSYASDISNQSEPPSDEMLRLIADLKSERDELKKDVDGWRNRLADAEKQLSVLMRRVENERRDAWVARERAGLLEIEKNTLQTTLAEKSAWAEEGWSKYHVAIAELDSVRAECEPHKVQVQRTADLESQLAAVQDALRREKTKREELEKELEVAGLLATPTPRMFEGRTVPSQVSSVPLSRGIFARRGGLGFRSIDSIGSFTDVESVDGSEQPGFKLKAVQEEDETDAMTDCSDEDELAGYEDEDENDAYAFHSSSSTSSLGSIEDVHRQDTIHHDSNASMPSLATSNRSESTSPSPLPSPEPAHDVRGTLSERWTFPVKAEAYAAVHETDDIDRFFGCLEDVDDSPPLGKFTSAESGKNIFSQALGDSDDDLPPFVLPADVGVEVGSPQRHGLHKHTLDAVQEEEEVETDSDAGDAYNPADDEFNGEEVEGGIVFTFNPPPSFDDFQDDSFNSSRSSDIQPTTPSPRASVSSLPRPTTAKSFTLSPVRTPERPASSIFAGFIPRSFSTPPTKQSLFGTSAAPAGSRITMVPSPSQKEKPASFIPQPRRSSPTVSRIPVPAAGRPISPLTKASASIVDDPISAQPDSDTEMKKDASCTLMSSNRTPSSPSHFSSPTLGSRLSHTISNLIPLSSWSPLSSKFSFPLHMYNIPTSLGSVSPSGETHDLPAPNLSRLERPFVPKERQLEKLRLRLADEGRISQTHRSDLSYIRNVCGNTVHI